MIEARHLVPSTPHARILRAALHVDPAVAQQAIDAWRSTVVIDDLDATSMRLLSLLADRLDVLDTDAALRDRVATIVRFAWLRTQALLVACRPVLADLAAGDTPFLLLKGAALLGAGAGGLGRRQLDDIDLLVPGFAVPLITGTLRARGFDSHIAEGLIARPRQFLDAIHSTAFANGRAEIDLHWPASPLARRSDVEERRWFGARHVDVAGVQVGVPSATEMLLLALEHDAVPVPTGAGRWVGDAAVLCASGEVDPVLLRSRADELGLAAVLDQAADVFTDLTGLRFPVAPRRRARLRTRLPEPAHLGPRTVEAGELWQRHRATAQPGWRGAATAAAQTWSGLGGAGSLRTRNPLPEREPGPEPVVEARDPWAWACRRVDLRFGVNDDGVPWLRSGWSCPEAGFTWTAGPRAVVEVPAAVAPGEPLVLDIVSHGLVSDQMGPYEVHWSVDATRVHVQAVTDSAQSWTTIEVPAGIAHGGTVRLQVDVRWPRSAVEAGTGTDLRRLGVGLSWVRLMSAWSPRPAPEPTLPEA